MFVLTSVAGCAGVFNASSAIFYPEQTDFSGGEPPRDFVAVMVNEKPAVPGEPYRPVRWREASDIAAKSPASLRLPTREYEFIEGDPWGFKVTDQSAAHQVIEVSHRDFSGIKTRYRVEGNRITPLSYKNDGGMLHAMLLTPVFLVCLWLAWRLARRTSRWIRAKAG